MPYTYEADDYELGAVFVGVVSFLSGDYFQQTFAERRATFEELFSRLDQALDQGNGEVISVVLRGIVDVARTSPLAHLGDLSQIRAALDDPNQVWEL